MRRIFFGFSIAFLFVSSVFAEERPYREVVNSSVSGLTFEATDSSVDKRLTDQARAFISFRRKQLSSKKKLQLVADCLANSKDNIFCNYMTERKPGKRYPYVSILDEASDDAVKTEKDPAYSQVADWLASASLSKLNNLREATLQRALRTFPEWEPLNNVAEQALTTHSCPSVALLTALGQKTEEFFPKAKYRALAVSLYERANECSNDNAADKARFRLSLLHIWNGECQKAEPVLFRLTEQKDSEFASRSLFWRVHCANTQGNKLLAAVLKGRALKDFPLYYHTLLLHRGKSVDPMRILLSEQEPMVLFRSVQRPELNSALRAIEVLAKLRANELADEILDTIAEKIESAESGLRLYAAILMGRFGDRIAQFRMLAGTFQDDRSTLSRSTLESFYPLRRFDALKNQRHRVDPLFVAALIRQESGFTEHARSPVGALGLMQIMPATARMMERVSKRELIDPRTNIRLGVRYLQGLLKKYRYDAELALAAYNAGPEKVDDWRRRYQTDERMLFVDLIPFKETRDYVALIGRNYYWYSRLYNEKSEGLPDEVVSRRPASQSRASKGSPQLVMSIFQ
jgi:soluble lytic murein transglycosylase